MVFVSVFVSDQSVVRSIPCLFEERSNAEEHILLREGHVIDSEEDTYPRRHAPCSRQLDAHVFGHTKFMLKCAHVLLVVETSFQLTISRGFVDSHVIHHHVPSNIARCR